MVSVPTFLADLELSKHLGLFAARGFNDVSTFRTMAILDEPTLRTTLRRWLAEETQQLGVKGGLTNAELEKLASAIREL